MDFEIDIANVTLKTERLTLRAFKQSDLPDFYRYGKVSGIGGKNVFTIVFNDKVIGSLNLDKCDATFFPEIFDFKCCELDFFLSKDYWGLGLMVEAVNRVIRYAFEEVGCDCLISSSFKTNTQSANVQRKCGFNDFKPIVYTTSNGTEEPAIARILWNSNVPLSERIYAYLRMLPKGRVATYGQVAEYLGDKHLARVVGNILHVNPDPDANPCFRIVNSEGHLAWHFGAPGGIENQKARMEADGIEVKNYKVDLKAVQFRCE